MSITRAKTSSIAQGPSTNKNLLAGNPVILGGSYESIATTTVGSTAQSTITFSSIPSTYKHLQIRAIAKSSASGFNWIRHLVAFNSDTTNSNYVDHILRGNGSAAQVYAETSTRKGFGAAASSGANIFMANVIDILDYTNTSKYKTSRTLDGLDSNNAYTGLISFESNLWMSTSAINRIDITLEDASNFTQYSSFALYGIK